MLDLRDDRTETYLRMIRENLNPQTQVVVVIFPTSRDDRYSAVKKLCCVESPVPSQVTLYSLLCLLSHCFPLAQITIGTVRVTKFLCRNIFSVMTLGKKLI